MALWDLTPADLILTLDHLVTLGEQPEDPHEALIYLEYLKNPPGEESPAPTYPEALRRGQLFYALLLELRQLGRQAPLRHRGFARSLAGLSAGKANLALRAMRERAEMGDGDAALALLQAALELSDEAVIESLTAVLPHLARCQAWLDLYPAQHARRREIVELLAPPAPMPLEVPAAVTPLRQAAPTRSLSVTGLEGPGMLLAVSSAGHLETIKISRDRVEIQPYRLVHLTSPRQIVRSRLSDDLHLLALFTRDGMLELVSRVSGKSLALLPNLDYQCFARTGNQILVGGPYGIYNVRTHKYLSQEPVRALGAGKLVCHPDGRVTLRGQERFHLDPAYSLRLAPDGRTLAVWDSHGEVEIFDLQGELVGRFYCAESSPDLTYDLDSRNLVLLQNGSLRRWALDGTSLPPIGPSPRKTTRSAPAEPLDLNALARHDGFFDRLQR